MGKSKKNLAGDIAMLGGQDLNAPRKKKRRAEKTADGKKPPIAVPLERVAAPPILLNLISAFLTEYNFAGTGRLFTVERQGRAKIEGWEDSVGRKLPKDLPSLTRIFKDFYALWESEHVTKDSSSQSEAGIRRKKARKAAESVAKGTKQVEPKADSEASSSGGSSVDESSSEESGEDTNIEDTPQQKLAEFSSSSAASSSNCEDDSELRKKEAASAAETKLNHKKKKSLKGGKSGKSLGTLNISAQAHSSKSKTLGFVEAVTRLKAASRDEESSSESASSSSSSSSSSDSDADDESEHTKSKVTASKAFKQAKEEESPPTSDSDRSSKGALTKAKKPINSRKGSTDSSATIDESKESEQESASSVTSTSADSSEADAPSTKKRKRPKSPIAASEGISKKQKASAQKAQNTAFSRIPSTTAINPKLSSNAYVPYDYAERAYQDLSITRGKGFTKEKNKKKRGSYRGGAIDVNGRKGIKFDD
ncbi:MAG: hypothetical protein M1824_000022 [Vezdaea acicularis]|nr:MAG: hypothetical protein M1824_000022 [Vezdaea acicularis]